MANNPSSTASTNRDDDSLAAAQVDIDGAKERITKLEDTVNNPDKLGAHLAEAAKNSSVFRKALTDTLLEIFNDHDTRKELKAVLAKVDRDAFWRWGKYVVGFLAWAATLAGAILAYVALQ
jgi:hypothetical protein